ncbi:YihY/virulence factor BrkB family protein [Anaplasmataceae bacterium AB001_6]|nr:YihY/virulence factor BrkB family protein [Anaplasmataceae bacterium AB001_6]
MKKVGIQRTLQQSVISLIDHDGLEFAGYLSFLTIITLSPFIIILTIGISKFATILNETIELSQYTDYIYDNVLENLLSDIRPFLEEAAHVKDNNKIISLIIISSLWTSSSAIEGLRLILNRAYRVKNIPHYIMRRILSVGQFIALVIIISCLLVAINIFPWIKELTKNHDIDSVFYTFLAKNVHIPVLITLLFLTINAIYYFIPNDKQTWSYHIPGSLLVLILWTICTKGLKLYITYSAQFSAIYGGIAGIITTMIFFYLLNLCIIYGAEFNYSLNIYLKKHKI